MGGVEPLSLSLEPNWSSLLDPVLPASSTCPGVGAQGPVWTPVPQEGGQRTKKVWVILLPALRSRALGLARRPSVSHRPCWGQEGIRPTLWSTRSPTGSSSDNCGLWPWMESSRGELGFTLNISGAGRSKPCVLIIGPRIRAPPLGHW